MWTRIWRFLRSEDAYTFSFQLTFLALTVGMTLLAITLWYAGGLAAKHALRQAATDAAYTAQSTAQQALLISSSGFGQDTWHTNGSLAQGAAQSKFNEEISSLHLDQGFANLSIQTNVTDSSVTVVASGDYEPLFLGNVVERFWHTVLGEVHMEVTVPQDYVVKGG